jgi:hypothetical protein
MPLFTHTRLTSPTGEIRLLSLDLDGDLDDIRCTLTNHSLNSRPIYCALSYEWGNPVPVEIIIVNGELFHARHNLWLFLQRVKAVARENMSQSSTSVGSQGATTQLWVDAICIDQTNIPERNTQVQLMGRIYRDARPTIVWLGWSDGLDPRVTSILRKEILTDSSFGPHTFSDFLLNGASSSS